MCDRIRSFFAPLLLVTFAVFCTGAGAFAEDAAWRVSKSSGDASVTTAGGQQAALAEGAAVQPGDNIRTGQTGRILLKRGEETILISPNSAIGIPADKKSGMATTIIQQAGSILLDVEKRNVQHFSVETPYLAAVVKGTQFRVTVNKSDSRVDVLRGQVEVQDFKSGQYAMVMPNQAATVSAQGSIGLLLSGSGTLSPVQQGTPRLASVSPLPAANDNHQAAAPPTRMASAPITPAPTAMPARAWAPVKSSTESEWTSMFGSFGKSLFGSSGHTSRHEDIALAVGLSCAIGFVVSAAVAFQRRRKSRKPVES
jgi:hypothetical protein